MFVYRVGLERNGVQCGAEVSAAEYSLLLNAAERGAVRILWAFGLWKR